MNENLIEEFAVVDEFAIGLLTKEQLDEILAMLEKAGY